MTSQQPTSLFDALRLAQAEFPTIPKGRVAKGKTFSYNYADLSDILGAVLPVLYRHGLALTQVFERIEGRDEMALVTSLAWCDPAAPPAREERGRWLHGLPELLSRMPIPLQTDPQELGAWITYARRYAICALLGITAEDDTDGDTRGSASHAPRAPRSDDPPRTYVPASQRPPPGRPAEPAKPAGLLRLGPWWSEPLGWGTTTVQGRPISAFTWEELAAGASLTGGRHGWLKAQRAWLDEKIAKKENVAWARTQLERVMFTMQWIGEHAEELPPPDEEGVA